MVVNVAYGSVGVANVRCVSVLAQALWRGEGEEGDRTRDWVLQQKSGNGLTIHSSTPSLLEHVAVATDGNISGGGNMDGVVQRLQLIASKIKGMTSDAASR